MRGHPEGNSILHKEKLKMTLPYMIKDDSISPSKKKKHGLSDNLDDSTDKYYTHKSKHFDLTENLLDRSTPDSLGEISSIAHMSEMTMHTTGIRKNRKGDVTFEKAVQRVRGTPDGAEKSFAVKNSNKISQETKEKTKKLLDEELELCTKENSPAIKKHDSIKPLERKKSIKLQIKQAAKKLKGLKTKGNLEKGRNLPKRKLPDASHSMLHDDTMVKKAKTKDMNWKDRRTASRIAKNHYQLIQNSKLIWEQLRKKDLSDQKRIEHCTELYTGVKGKIAEFSLAHDTARMIQCLIKYGTAIQKGSVLDEIKDSIVNLCKSKYGKFVVMKMMKYGNKFQRSHILKQLHGKVVKLIRHKESSEVIENFFAEYATGPQKLTLLEEFYGPSFVLFQTQTAKSLDQIIEEQPNKKEIILSNMKETLLSLIDKEVLLHSMVHRLFFEFFNYAEGKMKTEMIEALREGCVNMVHTREGARAVMHCLWHGTAKDRKVILKSFKTHILKICKEQYGFLVMLAVFDCVDDTKIVQKIILDEILQSLSEIADDQYGRKVLFYILEPRDPVHFHPDVRHILELGDKNLTSKKDMSVRHKELLDQVSPKLIQHVLDNVKDLVFDNTKLLLTLSIIIHVTVDSTAAMEAIADIAAEPFTTGADKMHIVEHHVGHLVIKRLINQDKKRLEKCEEVLFSTMLLEKVPEGSMKSWAACNRGCLILVK
ncbi:hypothetical protein SNE40_011153 [Patella caerulea]|uniref:PUM-HD domain-containing protein n=1 Tax=Patella caerulea TaxID=87958 RepID=A0AAN8JI65_PATCE